MPVLILDKAHVLDFMISHARRVQVPAYFRVSTPQRPSVSAAPAFAAPALSWLTLPEPEPAEPVAWPSIVSGERAEAAAVGGRTYDREPRLVFGLNTFI